MKTKFLCFFVLALLLSIPRMVTGAPAWPFPVKVAQPDGTELTILLHGDEFFSYRTTSDGYNILQDKDGSYCYATIDGANLVSTGIKANNPIRRTAEEKAILTRIPKGVAASTVSTVRKTSPVSQQETEYVGAAMRSNMNNGEEFKSLVILAEFQDLDFITPNPQQAFSNLLNQDGYSQDGASGSAWNYYNDNSNGKFNPNFVVVGPIKLPQDMAYYGGNVNGSDINPQRMAYDACVAAEAAGVNFADYLDETTGYVKDVFIFYAGFGENMGADANTIWPHRYWLTGSNSLTLNGVRIYGYACAAELHGAPNWYGSGQTPRISGIGVFCHEFGHVIGWPDFYDADGTTNGEAEGPNLFSVMASGCYLNESRTPCALNAWERTFTGWMETTLIDEIGEYTLTPLATTQMAYVINTDNSGEYFLLENRQTSYKWDRYIGGSGMLVYQVDQSTERLSELGNQSPLDTWTLSSNRVNSYAAHPCFRLLSADPTIDLKEHYDDVYRRASYIFFPGSNSVRNLTSKTTPALASWKGKATGLDLSNIQSASSNITFSAGSDALETMTIDAGQYDAFIKWEHTDSYDSWMVRCYDSNGSVVSAQETTKMEHVITGLKPNSSYDVEIYGRDNGSDTGKAVVGSFTTLPTTADMPAIKVTKLDSGQTYFQLQNASSTASTIVWYIDGSQTSNPLATLSAGEHEIRVRITNSDRSVEYVVKYVTVN